MQEVLKSSEVELMEFYFDPTAMTECLIPENFNVSQKWPNCKMVTLRDYQFAMQNYSYLIADNPDLEPELKTLSEFIAKIEALGK